MMTSKVTKSNVMDKVAMSESRMMSKVTSGAWRMAHSLILSLCFVAVTASAFAVTVTDTTPTSASVTGSAWTSPNNALSQDNNTADWKNTDQSYLVLTGFDFSSIPDSAQIDGITVFIRGAHSSGTANFMDYQVGLTKNGSSVAGNLKLSNTEGTTFSQTLANYTLGTNADLWGTTWTATEIKNANFGVMLTDNDTTQTGTNPGYQIDVMYITVDYTITCAANAPTDLSANAVSPTQVDLSWSDPDVSDCSVTDSFTFYRDGVALAAGTDIACSAGTMNFSDTTAAGSTIYNYTVRATDNGTTCESGDSNTANVTTPACTVTGNLDIVTNGTVYGDPADLTVLNLSTGATGLTYTVTEGATSTAPFSMSDDFGTTAGDLGNWTASDENPSSSWTLDNNATPSASVGPAADQSGSGFYVYSEATDGGNGWPYNYWLTSPSFDNANYTLSFDYWYNMNTNANNSCALYVEASPDNGTTWSQLRSHIGDVGSNVWQNPAALDLSTVTPTGTGPNENLIKVRFRVVAASSAGTNGWHCDVGLDTISISGPANSTALYGPGDGTSVDTSTGWTSGKTYNLVLDGNDVTCGTALPQAVDTFTWDSCSDTNGSSVSIGAPTNGATVIGIENIGVALVNATFAQYRIDDGPWISVDTPWDSRKTHLSSVNAPVSNVKVQVRAREDECPGRYIYDTPIYVTVDNTCVDDTPSTITVKVGQTVSGPTVDLTNLYTATGSVVTDDVFTYAIDDVGVSTPYDTSAQGTIDPKIVKFEVFGRDKTCGNKEVYGYGFVTIDNTCTRSGPTVNFDNDAKYVKSGEYVEYQVRVYNHDSPACPDESFDLSIVSTDAADFTSSITGATTLAVPAGESLTTKLRVSSDVAGTPDWTTNDTTINLVDSGASRGDMPADQTVTTTIYDANSMLHNSITTKSTKHGGLWGTSQAGAKYGEFTCKTCHAKVTTNIKMVAEAVNSPKPAEPFPGEGNTIVFKEVTGLESYGDDGRATPSSSSYVCEVCHTPDATKANGVNKHAFDMSGLGDSNHFNQQDCIECHEHRTGFQATCDVCHGYGQAGTWWPDSLQDDGITPNDVYADRLGAHQVHVAKIANYLTSGGDKNDGSATTIADMNNTCLFCHPKPGETNKDGAMHIVDTIGSDVDTADVYMDGTNVVSDGYFKYFDNTDDTNGTYDPTIQRCSNIDCHSNGQFTWSWYGDLVAPGQITDLSGVTGTELGSVMLDWTAPGNDGNTAGKAYGYEVRYSTSPIGSGAAYNSATIAGFPPTTLWPGFSQDMTVTGLNPATDYYFAIKSFDEAGNWSVVSNSAGPVTAKADTVPPRFYGLDTASPAYVDGAVNLSWSAATDRAEPITYQIWWVDSSSSINYAAAPDATTTSLNYQVTGLTNGLNYYFAVRAVDSNGNVDKNIVQKEAIPQQPAESDWMGHVYFMRTVNNQACGNTTLTLSGGNTYDGELSDTDYLCTPAQTQRITAIRNNGTTLRWTMPTAYASTTNITGANVRINGQERGENNDHSYRFRIGYTPDGSSYTWIGSVTEPLPAGYRGYFTVGLSTISGVIPAGNRLAIDMTRMDNVADDFRMFYASEAFHSLLTIFEQEDNLRPNAFTVNTPSPGNPAGDVTLSWAAATDPDGDPVTYDVFASLDNGATGYPILIAENISETTVDWDTIADGIGIAAGETVQIKVSAKDGLNHNESGTWYDSREAFSNTFTVNNTDDLIPPAAITDLHAEHRPKAGSVFLYWTAPGDDGTLGVAEEYDIRYSQSVINAGNFASATTVSGEPTPDVPGTTQGFEVLGLNPNELYFFAIKTRDEVPNWSGISNVPSSVGGPECGVCHSTPPDQPERAGTHAQHGYTQIDCSKCHGAESVSFTNDHADGVNKIAFNNPKFGYTNKAYGPTTEVADKVIYHIGGNGANAWLYDDANGGGGYNDIEPGGDNVDNGSCSGFNASGVTGCHGAAGTDPDDAGPLPFYPAPVWGDPTSVSCAMCHGDDSRANSDPYGRPFEDPRHDSKYAGNREIYKAAPPIDLKGNTDSNAVGQHLRHLNVSYRYTGDSCNLCHVNNEHADGTVDVVMDPSAAGPGAQWVPEATGPGTPGTCAGTSGVRCHGNNTSEPKWEVRSDPTVKLVDCNECHGFQGKAFDPANNFSDIPHVKDQGQVRNCTYCHVEGHPRAGYSITALSKANPAVVTSANHNLHDGDWVLLHLEGMTELDHWYGTVTYVDDNNFSLDGVNSSGYGDLDHGYWKLINPPKAISAIAKGATTVVTSVGHGLLTEDNVQLSVSGMVELDGYHGPITKIDDDNFSLDGVDSSTYGNFTSGDWIKIDGTIMVPNYSISGIDYSSGGIHLKRVVGGRLTLKSGEFIDTEAETCWGCHEDQPILISEWGTNQQAVTGSMAYDYGSLNQTSWLGATWTSPNFSYKTGLIQSTHSVNPDVTGPGVDSDADIHCSYCHDVHDLNKALSDNVSGRPYLRGTWMGNPYNEDGAPGRYDAEGINTEVFDYYAWDAGFGAVPRGATQSQMGGFWIDQNSRFPTASWTLSSSAGLCVMCHGSDVNNMNKFGNASDDWVGTNGHSNAVIGGSGMHMANVYNPDVRNEGNGAGGGYAYNDPGMGYQGTPLQTAEEMFGLRNNRGSDITGWTAPNATENQRGVVPYIYSQTGVLDGDNARWAFGDFAWAVDRSTTQAEMQYHRFSCSKCHNPHASRLPRLMITNCLDVRHNRWDNVFATDGDWTAGRSDANINWSTQGIMPYTGNDWTGTARNRQFAYATSAQNCHRYVEDTPQDAETVNPQEPGWNNVTPWNE